MSKKQDFINNKENTLLMAISLFKNDLSNKKIKSLIKNKMVMVNGREILNSSYLVKEGDRIEIFYEKRVMPLYNLDILYEDEYLIAINKPASLLSISNDKEKIVTAYRMVSDYVKRKRMGSFIFVVHRLDQDTSGILLFCKNEKIRDKMQENWNTVVKKRGYVALVEGKMVGSGTFHTFLMENKKQFVYSSRNGQGKEAITHYQVIKRCDDYSLVQVFIDTGRRNQIRVHFSEGGHPIVGDKKYGCKINPIKRLCLHANILEFIHPVSKKLIHIECDMPLEFKKILNKKAN